MSLYIRNEETDRLARELAERTGANLTDAITRALRNELARTPPRPCSFSEKLAAIRAVQDEIARLPVLQAGSDDELVYDAEGLAR